MFLQFQISNLDLVPADAFVSRAPAPGAAKIKISDIEFGSAIQTAVPAWANFDFELQALQLGLVGESFKGKLQSIRIYGRELSYSQTHPGGFGARMASCLRFNSMEHGLSNAELVHI
jgi:hypothetical protein